MKPLIHAESSVEKYGGIVEDYLPIHSLMDESKSTMPDQRHRALTHNSWFLFILEKIFGYYITNEEGKKVSVRQIGEDHILEDFDNRFIPSAQDWLENIEYKDWMENGKSGHPRSYDKLSSTKTREEQETAEALEQLDEVWESFKKQRLEELEELIEEERAAPESYEPQIDDGAGTLDVRESKKTFRGNVIDGAGAKMREKEYQDIEKANPVCESEPIPAPKKKIYWKDDFKKMTFD